ncbi:hypothetical protein P691DRAFT_802431 [Macrolepiota fuliginosa MF-IS2]|uniref:Uncharacterized protein n=1 Tax=Macrolepiota fuliginosa MF-IS2 TaxID=1400762 RepID=A0A9P5XP12_9AGAR|nr:hypothetical protein P691DRAFT_802431 [Macrolepiota fuliginosa MF-IS2]
MAEQDGAGQSQTSVNPPSGGWPTGASFRVNLVKSVEEQSTIYAQSNEFSIKAVSSSASIPLSTSGP